MIVYKQGNIFNTECEMIVNPVNCIGVSGAGLARKFAKVFPHNDRLYRDKCSSGEVGIGKVFITNAEHSGHASSHVSQIRYVCNFPTKFHYRNPSRLEWILAGMQDLLGQSVAMGVTSVAIPALGCGLGQLDWFEVSRVINDTHDALPAKITDILSLEVYPPNSHMEKG